MTCQKENVGGREWVENDGTGEEVDMVNRVGVHQNL